MTDEHTTEITLTPDQINALIADGQLSVNSDGETSHEEAEVFVTEDTADHVVH